MRPAHLLFLCLPLWGVAAPASEPAVPPTYASVAAAPGPALGAGEKLVFQARWKFFDRVGRIVVAADDVVTADGTPEGGLASPPLRRIRVDVSSDGMVANLYTYRATGVSFFDLSSGRMLSASYKSAAGSDREERSIRFDLEKRLAFYRDALAPRRNADLTLPDGELLDFITCLVTARRWNLQPGDSRDIVVLADKRFYTLRLRAERRETITAALGKYAALVVVPEPIGPPRGIFKKGGGFRIWIEDSPRALPIRVDVRVPIGTVTVDLVRYDPPQILRGSPGVEFLQAGK
jgi:hypothetical protein